MKPITLSLDDESISVDLFNSDLRVKAYAYDQPPVEYDEQTQKWQRSRIQPSTVTVWFDESDREG